MTDLQTLLRVQSESGCLAVRGPDAKTWLNGVVTCDAKALSEQRGVLGLLLNKQGKIQSDLLLLEGGGSVYVRVAPGLAAQVHSELDRMLIMEDAELVDRSAELVFLSLHGPRALELASGLGERLAFGAVDPTGHGGAALVVQRAALDASVAALVQLGARLDDGQGWLALRLEGAWPEFAVDYSSSDNPHEASLERRTIAWDKGCYLGQEVVCMQDMRGKLKRRVVSIELAGGEPPPPGTEVRSGLGTEVVGQVTSSGFAARLGKPLALAMVKAPHFEAGHDLVVGTASGMVRAVGA
jgi:tRNA-modifying protein YgfZ